MKKVICMNTRKAKLDFLYNHCEQIKECKKCVLNNSEHKWDEECIGKANCPDFIMSSDDELERAIKLIQESKDLDKVHNTEMLVEAVNHPSHYNDGNIEVIDFIEDKKLGFCLGNAVKYISRAGKKGNDKEAEDIKKAIWYLNRYLAAYSDENRWEN